MYVHHYFSFLEEFKHFDDHVHQLYTKSSYLVDDESWPPFTPNKFINLLLIRHLSTKRFPINKKACHLSNNNEESFTTNNILELFQHGEKVEPHNKIILIRGVPGIGKTILSKEIAYQWADNKLLSETEIVLMLFMRDPGIKKITELKFLVHYFYGFSKDTEDISAVCAKHLLQMGGINVTIILDGLDEIPAEVIDSTYIRLLLDRRALPCCRIVVTSRPAVSIMFQSKVDIEAEILGFTDENINIFIQNELKNDKQEKLTHYLKQNKNLYHLCYIPFILSVLVCVAKECDELPSNRVEVYKKFVVYTISRFLKRFEHSDHAISTIDELPKEYKSYLFELSKYAFNALEIDQVVFTRKDITKDFSKLANAPENWYGLGLLNSVKYFKIVENSDCISYNFLHKSIQEFLAALYVTTLSEAEQFIIIKKSFFQEKYLNMWTMYIGLNENLFSFWHFLSGKRLRIWSKLFGTTAISHKILHSKIQCLYLFHCFSELRDNSMCNVVGTLFRLGKLDLSFCTLSLNEINTIIFILERSPTTYWSELNLSHCNIGDAGCQHLCKGLSTLNHKVYFDKIDIDDNRLSLESLQHLVMLLVQCKTQKLYATNNIITMDNSKIAYLVMEYAFAVKAISNQLSIIVNSQERAIFCQSENNTIIKYLNSRQMISGLYYNNCHLNDEVIGLLTDLIIKYEMITDLYFWNSNISEDYLKGFLSVMPQGNYCQFVFVYEALKDDKSIVEMMLSTLVSFTFIFLSKASLILFNASYSHITHLIFANPMLPETTLIETICLSQCELSDETINLLIQLFNQCNNISTLILLNNTFSSNNLKQLMYAIKSKYLLRTIFVCHNTMTYHDINLLGNEFKNIRMLLINDEELKGYNYCDIELKHASQLQIFPSLTVLQLHYCDIKDNASTYLYKLFQHCDHLREITIYYCLVYIHTVNKLLQQISTVTTLRKLNLRGNKLNEKNTQALASVIANNNELEELYLGTNNLQSGVIKLAKALKKLSSLKVLDLDDNNIPEEAAVELSAAIRANNSLEKLWLFGNNLGSSTVMIVNALKEVTTLTELNLNNNRNRSEEFAPALTSIISANESIETLLLSDNNLNDDGIIKIAQSLCKHTKLKMVNLQSNNITEKSAEALASIISSNTGLEELYLGYSTIQLGVITISTALKNISSLKVLDLDNNNIPEEAADELSAAIRANNLFEKLWLGSNHLGSSTVMIVNALKQVTALKELDLNNNQNRNEKLASALTSIISVNKSLETLLLSDNNLNDDGIINIAQSLCKHTKLKIIHIQNNNLTEKGAEALASIISSNTGLEELYLGNNTIQLGVITISTALKSISSLKVLYINNNNIPEEAADELSAAIRANKSLEKLWLSRNHLGSSTVMIVNALKQVTTLKVLNLNGNQNRSEELAPALASIISHNNSMESLLLNGNNLNNDGVIKIAQSLCKHTKLKMINLQINNITEKGAEALASIILSNTRLEELYLGNNTIQSGVIKLAKALKKLSSLKVLDLDDNNIHEEAADELSTAIRANNTLERLRLDDNHLGSSTVSIVNALIKVTTLKVLNLNNNQNRSEELASALTSIISANKSLEILLLSDNNLNDDGVIKIAQSLCKHTKLKMINLQSNNITDKAAKALASIISSNTGLEELYLGNNTIQLGVIKLAKALKKLSSLKVLDLDNNNIPEEAADELSAAIRANSALEKLWLSGNHLRSSTVIIVNALKQVRTLKELNLNNNRNRSEELAPVLTSVISHNKYMKSLLLRDNNLNDDGVTKIAQSLCKHTKLKMINLRSNNMTEKIAEALASIISSNTGLEQLYLGNNTIQLGVITISTALKNISSLKVLDLDNNNIPEEAADELSAAIRANNLLEKLCLGGNHLGSSTVMIVNALKQVRTLKELNLNNNQNRSEELVIALVFIISDNKSLEILLLSDNNLSDGGVIKIAQSLCKHTKLKIINLQSNNITEKSAEALASIISSNTALEELCLSNNQLQLGVITLSTALKNVSSLKVLYINNNNIPEDAADGLSAAIKANNSLEKLWLGDNHLGSSTVMIVNALKEVTTLKELDLNGNRNRSEELAPALTSIILHNKSIERLVLSDNSLNDDGVIKIAQSLCKHTELKMINLRSNNITEKSAEALASIISSNTGLEDLYLGNNQLQLGVNEISTVLTTISSLKVLDLVNNNIHEQVSDQLSSAIRANNLIEKLWLNNNNLGSSMSVIAKACCHISSLKDFSFKNTGISVKAINDIAAFIRHNSSIQLLSMSDNNLQSSGFMVIAEALKITSSLKLLYAYGISVTSTVAEELSSVIEHNLSMERLSLGDNLLENGLMQIAESCSRLISLKVLELSHNCLSPSQVVNFASTVSKCNSLEALSMGGICLSVDENLCLNIARIFEMQCHVFVTDIKKTVHNEKQLSNYRFDIFPELLRMIFCWALLLNYQHLNVMYQYDFIYISYQHKNKFYENKIPYKLFLQEAKQKLSQIHSKAMISSLQVIRTLKVINLENNNIDEDAATELAGHLHCNNILEQLWLRSNELYDKGASVVLQSLHNLSTLLILDLSYNHLSSELADGITVVVGNNCSLQQLWLDGNELLTRGVVRIASALKKLSSLRILSLCSNGITDDAAEEISNVIINNTLLVDLLLGNNQLESKGICTIAMAIRKLFILRKLDLSNNHVTHAAEELAITLSNCANLKQLFLNDNMLGTEGIIKIADALKCINTLQALTLSNNNITKSAADILVDVLKNNISLKILLISGNDLQTIGVTLIAQTAAKNITTLQLLDVSNNNIIEGEKKNIKMIFANYNNFTIIV